MSLTLDIKIPTVADLLASPLAKYITLSANDCGYRLGVAHFSML